MKTDLTPKLIKSIDQSTILWFQRSNCFTIVSNPIYELLKQFLNTETPSIFIQLLQEQQEFDHEGATKIASELEEFLNVSNLQTQLPIGDTIANETISIPADSLAIHYSFGTSSAQVNYGSEIIKGLFHPQLAHFKSNTFEADAFQLDIFKIADLLYLYKNGQFVYASETKNYHFLQGAFSLELTNHIHNKIDNNWLATFHASTICDAEEAIMIVGESGNGKSTLSALLTANGLDLLADDFTPMYAEDMNLYRYPNAVSIKKGAFNILEKEVRAFKDFDTHFNGTKQVSVKYLPPPIEFSEAPKNLPCHKIVYVKYAEESSSELRSTSAETILQALIPDSWISPQPQHAKAFLNWLGTVSFYELHYSDNSYAIDSFKNLFDKSKRL